VPGELPGSDEDTGADVPMPDGEDDGGTDGGSSGYEPHEDEDGDATGMFDTLEDAPDVDRDSISEWYDDMMT
jgi:hypothetical protein